MRHRKSGKKLNMDGARRKAMFRNMANSLITHEAIRTTEARAKELRKVADRLVTYALKNDVAARRLAYKYLGSHQQVKRLFDEIGPLFAGGGGGYTRVIKLDKPRAGDCAPMAIIEFTKKTEEKDAGPASQKAVKSASVKEEAAPQPEEVQDKEEKAAVTKKQEEQAVEEPVAEETKESTEPKPKEAEEVKEDKEKTE